MGGMDHALHARFGNFMPTAQLRRLWLIVIYHAALYLAYHAVSGKMRASFYLDLVQRASVLMDLL